MEAPCEARFMPVAAAALLGLMMALSLGVDASPLRIHPKESKAPICESGKTEVTVATGSEEHLIRVRKKLKEHAQVAVDRLCFEFDIDPV